MSPDPASRILDTPEVHTGVSSWLESMGAEDLQLLQRLAQTTAGLGLLPSETGHLRAPVERRQQKFNLVHVEIIGMDVSASIQVTEISDGVEVHRSSHIPRRAVHTMDGHAVWLGEDGSRVLQNGESVLLPDAASLVGDDTSSWITWHALPWDPSLECLALHTPDGQLLLGGLDFMVSFDRILLPEHPAVLFPSGCVEVSVRSRKPWHPASFVLRQTTNPANATAAALLLRRAPTAGRLQRGLEALLNLTVMPTASTVEGYIPLAQGGRYLFTNQDLLVPYDHVPETFGNVLPDGYQLGQLVRVRERGDQGENWWQALDWSEGLSLDGLVPIPGLVIPPRPVRALAVEEDSRVAVRLHLEGEPANVTRYWKACRDAEASLPESRRMATLLDLEDTEERGVDMLAILFNNLLGRRAIVLECHPSVREKAEKFVREHMPVTAVLVVKNNVTPDVLSEDIIYRLTDEDNIGLDDEEMVRLYY